MVGAVEEVYCTCVARIVGIECIRCQLYQLVIALHITVGRVAIALALIERTEEHGLVGQDKARSARAHSVARAIGVGPYVEHLQRFLYSADGGPCHFVEVGFGKCYFRLGRGVCERIGSVVGYGI